MSRQYTVEAPKSELHRVMRKIFNKDDPMGLKPGKPGWPPEDEYDSEIESIIKSLPCEPSVSELNTIIFNVFVKSFSIGFGEKHIAGKKERYNVIAIQLHEYLFRD